MRSDLFKILTNKQFFLFTNYMCVCVFVREQIGFDIK